MLVFILSGELLHINDVITSIGGVDEDGGVMAIKHTCLRGLFVSVSTLISELVH